MVAIYVRAIINKQIITGSVFTIDRVPEEYKVAVLESLTEKGYDGYGNPL